MTKPLFTAIAGVYDRMNRLLSLGLDIRWRRKAVALVSGEPSAILDLASGTGDFAFALARRFPNATIVGVDLTPAMLDLARAKNTFPNVTFREGDAQRLVPGAGCLVLGAGCLVPGTNAANLRTFWDGCRASVGRFRRNRRRMGGTASLHELRIDQDLRPNRRSRRDRPTFGCPPTLFRVIPDFAALPLKLAAFVPGTINLVTCAFGFRNFPDKSAALAEARRVLAPDGELLVLEFFRPTNAILGALTNLWLRLVSGLFARRNASAYAYLRKSIRTTIREDAFVALARSRGFVLEDQRLFFPCCSCLRFRAVPYRSPATIL